MEPYVVLARRYRPRTFEEVLGQDAIGQTLRKAIETGRVAHAYLFAGPRGVGKTSMARILAKSLCCQAADGPTTEPCQECEVCKAVSRGDDLDVIEIDGASNRGIDEVRDIRDNARFAPARARQKIYIIDEVHMLTEQAFNALLKILEEPPPHVKFVFATTGPQKVPATILSRCQRFDFRRIPTRTIVGHLRRICEEEGVEANEEVLLAVAQASAGGMRDAQSLLDQLITLGEDGLAGADLTSILGAVSTSRMEEIFRAVGGGDEAGAIAAFEKIYEQGIDPAEFLRQGMAVARDMLVLLSSGPETELVDLPVEARLSLHAAAEEWGQPRVLYALGLFTETLKSVKVVGEGRALTELALVKLARAGRLRSLDDIVKDLEDLSKRIGPAGAASTAAPPSAEPAPPRGRSEDLFGGSGIPEGALAGEDSLSIDTVKRAWPEILAGVREESASAGSCLASGRVLGLRDESVTVGFPPQARFQKGQLEDPDTIRIVEQHVAARLGRRLSVDLVVTESVADSPPGEEEEGDDPEGGRPAPVSRQEMELIGREPIVNALKDVLEARLVHIERT